MSTHGGTEFAKTAVAVLQWLYEFSDADLADVRPAYATWIQRFQERGRALVAAEELQARPRPTGAVLYANFGNRLEAAIAEGLPADRALEAMIGRLVLS